MNVIYCIFCSLGSLHISLRNSLRIDETSYGFTDIEEMSGLIVSSNCKIVNTDYMKADTDDDGLDDNEEVDVELTKVEIPGKL